MDWGQNTYLKDPNTITILPAPVETRTEGIEWYEVQINLEDRSFHLLAFDANGAEIERADHVWLARPRRGRARGRGDDAYVFASTFAKGGQQIFEAKTIVMKSEDEGIKIRVEIDNEEVGVITASDPMSHLNIRWPDNRIPAHWGRMIDILQTHAIALKSRAVTANSWSCSACVNLGAAALGATYFCFRGAAPACFAALGAWAAFIENCAGACAPEEESG